MSARCPDRRHACLLGVPLLLLTVGYFCAPGQDSRESRDQLLEEADVGGRPAVRIGPQASPDSVWSAVGSRDYRGAVKTAIVTFEIGDGKATKCIETEQWLDCSPNAADAGIRMGGQGWLDMDDDFVVWVVGHEVCVKRIDFDGEWSGNLAIHCAFTDPVRSQDGDQNGSDGQSSSEPKNGSANMSRSARVTKRVNFDVLPDVPFSVGCRLAEQLDSRAQLRGGSEVLCLPAAPEWPYRSNESWRSVLGERVTLAVRPNASRNECGGLKLGSSELVRPVWCLRAMARLSKQKSRMGIAFGPSEKFGWSTELNTVLDIPTRRYDCQAEDVWCAKSIGDLCMSEVVPRCLEPATLVGALQQYEALSVHLQFAEDSGRAWEALEKLLSTDAICKIRSLDLAVQLGARGNTGKSGRSSEDGSDADGEEGDDRDAAGGASDVGEQAALESKVRLLELLSSTLCVVGSDLEERAGSWQPETSCSAGSCLEPSVHTAGGFDLDQFSLSAVSCELLGRRPSAWVLSICNPSAAAVARNTSNDVPTVKTSANAMPKTGLPVLAAGMPRPVGTPDWLVVGDVLAVAPSNSKFVILSVMLIDGKSEWGRRFKKRPRWLRACISMIQHHARQHGHGLVLRWRPRNPDIVTFWQKKQCLEHDMDSKACERKWEHQNFQWEKHRMMEDYLVSDNSFTHALLIDADAALVRGSEMNTLGAMASTLEAEGKDVLVTENDWLMGGSGSISTAVIFARKTPFARALFHDILGAHELGHGARDRGPDHWQLGLQNVSCLSSERECLQSLLGQKQFVDGVHLASGRRFSRGGCTLKVCSRPTAGKAFGTLGLMDPELDVIHFSFSSGTRAEAGDTMCEHMRALTGHDPPGWGCDS